MRVSLTTKIRLALLTTVAAGAVVAACGNGDDDDTTPKSDAGTKLDATGGGGTTDGSGGGGSNDGSGGGGDDSGGTGSDGGGATDGGGSDAGDGGYVHIVTPVSCSNYLYCEDFESYTNASAITSGTKLGPWGTSIGGKTDAGQTMAMGVDAVKPFSGSYALHLTAPAGESTYGQLSRSTTGGVDIGANMYGRAMVYFSNAPLPGGSAPLTDSGTYGLPSGVHSWIFDSSGHSPELDASVSANIIVGNPKLALNYSPGDYGPGASKDAGSVSAGTWHCLQWQYDGSGSTPADVMNVWFDGFNEVHTDPSLTYGMPAESLKMASDWTQLVFGFTHYQTTQVPQDVYLDDFAIDAKMVPCPTP